MRQPVRYLILTMTRYLSKITIGIDPASNGAAVILENGIMAVALAWKPRTRQKKRVYEISMLDDKGTFEQVLVTSGGAIGLYISNLLIVQKAVENGTMIELACEDAYIGKNFKTGIIVARFAGSISGVIEATCGVKINWVRATAWRHFLFRLNPFTSRKKAKISSLKLIPILLCDINIYTERLGKLDHITDAAGVALWLFKSTTDKWK